METVIKVVVTLICAVLRMFTFIDLDISGD